MVHDNKTNSPHTRLGGIVMKGQVWPGLRGRQRETVRLRATDTDEGQRRRTVTILTLPHGGHATPRAPQIPNSADTSRLKINKKVWKITSEVPTYRTAHVSAASLIGGVRAGIFCLAEHREHLAVLGAEQKCLSVFAELCVGGCLAGGVHAR